MNGVRDTDYYTSGLGGGKLTLWMNNKSYIATDQTVRRLGPDGTQDASFIEMNAGPYFSSLQGGDYHVFPDGRVLMTGTHQLNDPVRGFVGYYNLIWFSNTGYLDTTRVHRQGNGSITRIREQPDGRFLCSGNVQWYDGQPVSVVFRVEADGAVDPSYSSPLEGIPTDIGSSFRGVGDIEPLADGRTLVGGYWRLAGSTDTIGVMRLMPDGSQDPSFDPVPLSASGAFTNWIFPATNDILPLPDGRMIIVGNFDHVRGVPRGGIAMINADGSLNEEYFVGASCGNYSSPEVNYRYIAGIVPAPDGSYYIYGAYRGYNDGTTSYWPWEQGFVSRLYGLNVGVREHERFAFKLYPNPANATTTIELQHLPSAATVSLRDALGREVLQQRLSERSTTVQLQALSEGIYTLQFISEGKVIAQEKLIVQP
ncbi:MAG: T9SS type A sorting domain-containing protein [Flavobacteriales bacterium]|nr:T9SS type A sorting domain-containing protein [Flavobacteriales bacterium]